ncbi:MAG: DNA recombination protein RmuC [Acidobacteriota bacterium]
MSSLLRRASVRYLLRHPWQFGLSILGVALGVSVVVSVDLANASAGRAFELSTEAVTGRTTHQVIGGGSGIPEDLYRRLSTMTDHMARLGRQLDSSVAQYNRLVGSFDAKVIPGARKFAELGVPANEEIESPEPVEKQARTPATENTDNDTPE